MSSRSERYRFGVRNEVFRQLEQQAKQARYFSNPVLWARERLGVELWDAQAEVAMMVVDNKNVVCKAGHEVGKSYLAGVLICWWVDTRWQLPGGCFVVSTAPSLKQINAIVWREVRKFHALSKQRFADNLISSPLPGRVTASTTQTVYWTLPDGVQLGYGAKPPESKEDTMSGIHARYVLAVGDEAVGLSETLIDDLGNITSNATSRRFLICNPTNPLSYVATIFKKKITSWATATISVFDSPNFHGKGVCDETCKRWSSHKNLPPGLGFPPEVLESLVDESYVRDKLAEWGSDKSPKYIARVLGEFAWDAGPTLISVEDLAVALDTDLVPNADTRGVLGVDVARYGEDHSVAYYLHDGRLRLAESWSKSSGTDTARRIHQIALDNSVTEVRIDGSGMGGPIADMVRELSEGRYIVIDMIGGGKSPDKDRWRNARAYWFDEFARKTRSGELDIDENDEQLQEELLGIEYRFPASGVQALLIESKDEMKKRGVKSPDFADAAVYAVVDTSPLFDEKLKTGDRLRVELAEWDMELVGPGNPI